jgi:hypothetical protein
LRRLVQIVGVVVAGVLLLATLTVGVLIGLNAECSGPSSDCPRSDAYRAALVAIPPAAALLLVVGGVWSARRRSLRPLVLAEAAVIALAPTVDAVLNGPDGSTFVLLAVATVIAAAALRPAE